MSKEITRRSFIKKSAAIGTTTILAGKALDKVLDTSVDAVAQGRVDVSVVEGSDYYRSTLKAVEELGGVTRFIPKGSKVAILPNAQRNNPGSYTSPEVVRGVIKLCKDAEADAIDIITLQPLQNWESMDYTDMFNREGVGLKIVDRRDESLFKTVPISRGLALKEAQIMKELDNYDLFVNVPITKDHAGTKFTGTLKNMMGLNFSRNNRTFHKQNWDTDINAIKHLEQCVADLNLIVKPALNIVDATEFITTMGPFGPGELARPNKVIAGVDRVAIDAYCCTLWGLKPEEIYSLGFANKHGLGEIDPENVNIREISL